ncbi:MAG: hypothetical protein F6K53_40460 [Moorea sp. SIO4A1]|uniref:hypothetical protein n=1 Tax=Moorena sp. SIO4A1 TaxID=2607835 RepID=UPI0014500AE4|nr:hypothetical protein [Moorena sp. SIO4A1]NEQ63279.1 hypothetical protein [Moorena sp. SIO4A1]
MVAYQNPDFNVEVSQVVATSTGASTPDIPPGELTIPVEISQVVATEGVPSTLPTPSGNAGLPTPLKEGAIAVGIIFALAVLLKTTIEAITKLVKEAKDD